MAEYGFEGAETSEQRRWQLAMAFGQGAGTMHASGKALALAFSTYGKVADDPETWNANIYMIIEFGRALGRTSAAHALRAGRCVIDSEDVEFALKVIQKSQIEPVGKCPLTERMMPKG